MTTPENPESLALNILRKLLRGGDKRDGWVDFGHRWEEPFLQVEVMTTITDDELAFIVTLEGP